MWGYLKIKTAYENKKDITQYEIHIFLLRFYISHWPLCLLTMKILWKLDCSLLFFTNKLNVIYSSYNQVRNLFIWILHKEFLWNRLNSFTLMLPFDCFVNVPNSAHTLLRATKLQTHHENKYQYLFHIWLSTSQFTQNPHTVRYPEAIEPDEEYCLLGHDTM
jgi:hypothetical protein